MDDTYLHTIPETISASDSTTVSSDSTTDSSEDDYTEYSSLDDELELSDEKSSTSSSYCSLDIDLNKIPLKPQRKTNYQSPSSTTSKKQQQRYHSKFDIDNYEFSQPSNMNFSQSLKQDTSLKKEKKREKVEQSTSMKKSTNSSSRTLSRTYNDSFPSSYPTQNLSSSSSDENLYSNYFNQEKKNDIEEEYPLPSPITQTVDELVKGERKFSQDNMTYREKKEYKLLQKEYKQNEKTIYELRKEVVFISKQYIALKKQQRNELNQMISKDKEYLQEYIVEELEEMNKGLSKRFEDQQELTMAKIKENYESPVNIMYKKTKAITQNNNRSWFGKILFSIVLILEFVWNWIKQEWNHYASNSQKEKSKKKLVKSSAKRKTVKSKPEKKKKRKTLQRTLKKS